MKRKRPLAEALARGRPPGPAAAAAAAAEDDDAFAELSEAAVGIQTLHRAFCGLLPVVPTAAQALLAPRGGTGAFETVCPLRVALLSQLLDVTRRARGELDADVQQLVAQGDVRQCRVPGASGDLALVATEDLLDWLARRRRAAAAGATGAAAGTRAAAAAAAGATAAGAAAAAGGASSPAGGDPAALVAALDFAHWLVRHEHGPRELTVHQPQLAAWHAEWAAAGCPAVAAAAAAVAAGAVVAAPSPPDDGGGGTGRSRRGTAAVAPDATPSPAAAAPARRVVPLVGVLQVLLRMGFLARRTQGAPRTGVAAAAVSAASRAPGGALSITAAGSTIPRAPRPPPPPLPGPPLVAGTAAAVAARLDAGDSGAGPDSEAYWLTVPESSRLWAHLAAGRAELLARLARRRFGEMPRAEAEAQPLRSCPLDARFVVREACGSGAVGVVRTSAGEFLRLPGR